MHDPLPFAAKKVSGIQVDCSSAVFFLRRTSFSHSPMIPRAMPRVGHQNRQNRLLFVVAAWKNVSGLYMSVRGITTDVRPLKSFSFLAFDVSGGYVADQKRSLNF